MPTFEGDDVYGWIYRVERFFDIQGLFTNEERLRAVVLCMEGAALSWYRWNDRRMPFRSWEHLKAGMLERFQPSQQGTVYEQFLTISQEGTARAYVTLFESLAAQLEGVSEQIQEGTFLKGLKAELRTSVRVLQPVELAQAMRLAVMIDESKAGSTSEPTKSTKPAIFRPAGGSGIRNPPPLPALDPRPKTQENRQPFKRLTEAEVAEKRAKGLCFRCDAKFAPGHRCPNKTLQVLLVQEEEEDDGQLREGGEEHAHLDHVEVSAHAFVGITTPHTMKLHGTIRGTAVVVLIDSGATHNFISLSLVGSLVLQLTEKKCTGVMLGNGKKESSYGICREVELHLPGVTIREDFYPLELGSTDIILGMKWLRQLGEMRVNWRELTMVFESGTERVTLRGNPGLKRAETSLQALARSAHHISEGYYVVLASLLTETPPQSPVHSALDDILLRFVEVFETPVGLPPLRGHEHRITLKNGTEPLASDLIGIPNYRKMRLRGW